MAPTSGRFNPVDQNLLVMDNSAGDAAAQADLSLIKQAPKPNSKSLFVAGEGSLLGSNPGNFPLSDDTTRHRFQKDVAESHERDVTNLLQSASVSGLPWLSERKSWAPAQHYPPLRGDSLDRTSFQFLMKKITGPLRRAFIYGAISYGGLVLINNSELNLPNMWVAYLPMFVGVYVLTQWLDRKIGG